MLKRITAIAVAAASLVGFAPRAADVDAATQYRVVGTGDSILFLAAREIAGPGRWFDLEQGRQAYIAGNMGRGSTASIWPTILRASKPGGWIVVQDNGAQVSDADWRTLMRGIVYDVNRTGRCLALVLPVFHPNWSQSAHTDSVHKRDIMLQEGGRANCRGWVNWHAAVMNDPGLVYDGQHPSVRGRAWLGRALTNVVG
jgi:hypothetical protein